MAKRFVIAAFIKMKAFAETTETLLGIVNGKNSKAAIVQDVVRLQKELMRNLKKIDLVIK